LGANQIVAQIKCLYLDKKMITEEEFLTLAKAKYATINTLNEKPTMLDYEQGLVDILNDLGREVIQANLSKNSKDRRKKRNSNQRLGQSK